MLEPLEDDFTDVLKKAQHGLSLKDRELSLQSGVPEETLRALRKGTLDEPALRAVAPALRLHPQALVDLALGRYHPQIHQKPVGLAQFTSAYRDMRVNAWIIWDPRSRQALIFDTGTDARALSSFLRHSSLHPVAIYITHNHADHIACLPELRATWPVPVRCPTREPVDAAERIGPDHTFTCGTLQLSARLTYGHSVGGMSYVIEGLSRRLVVVGDALFAGSMGGGRESYADALRTTREAIFSLPDDTLVCPGHGPLTLVGLERKHNPFFA